MKHGNEAFQTSNGTITPADRAANTIAIKTEDGAEAPYHLSKDVTIDTERGVVEGAKYTAKEGEASLDRGWEPDIVGDESVPLPRWRMARGLFLGIRKVKSHP